jgi:hypothetical protein
MGVRVRVSTIAGFPFEGVGDMERTFEFVLELIEQGVSAYMGVPTAYPGSRLWSLYENGKIDLIPITKKSLFRNYGGLFAERYAFTPWFVPNHFMPQHSFLPQERLEYILSKWLFLIEKTRGVDNKGWHEPSATYAVRSESEEGGPW